MKLKLSSLRKEISLESLMNIRKTLETNECVFWIAKGHKKRNECRNCLSADMYYMWHGLLILQFLFIIALRFIL